MSDLTEKVIGFRGWAISRGEHGLTLGSTGIGGEWEPGVNEAVCKRDYEAERQHNMQMQMMRMGSLSGTSTGYDRYRPPPWYQRFHAAPHPGCDCGFYAVHELDHANRWNGTQSILGAVTAWGRMEIHREGFRAQYIQPVLLALPEEVAKDYPYAAELLRECAARYGCGIVKSDELEKAAQEFGEPVPENLKPEPPPPPEPAADVFSGGGGGYYYTHHQTNLATTPAGSVMAWDLGTEPKKKPSLYWPIYTALLGLFNVGMGLLFTGVGSIAVGGICLLVSLALFTHRWLNG